MAVGYKFPILNSDGSASSTMKDLEDMFVRKDQFLTSGIWTWGRNNLGQLGLGTIVHRSSPIQVGALTTWRQVSGGNDHSLAIKTDGTLWGWGNSTLGQLGLGGNTISLSSPIQVGALTNWKQVAASNSISAAIKTDGTLWMWGNNAFGQLGLGNATYYSSPKQVGSITTWYKILATRFSTIALLY